MLVEYDERLSLYKTNYDNALRDAEALISLAAHFREVPGELPNYYGAQAEGVAIRAFRQSTIQNPEDSALLFRALKDVQSLPPLPSVKKIIGEEACLTRASIEALPNIPDKQFRNDEDSNNGREFLRLAPVRDWEEATTIREYREVWQELPAEDHDLAGLQAQAHRESQIKASELDVLTGFGIGRPWWEFNVTSEAESATRRRLAETGIKLLITRNKTGALPPTLPLDGEVTTDPFSNKPFIYKRVGTGFRLYSVGPNHEVNGGDPKKTRFCFNFEPTVKE